GSVLVGVIGRGTLRPSRVGFIPEATWTARDKQIGRANNLCATLWGLRPVALQPKGVVMTYVDLGPRLIAITHHDAIAGPYHRNGDAILDVQHAFGRSANEAHAIIRRHGATMLMVCPNHSESTNYRARNPGGFYDQLAHGEVPAW